MYPYNTMYPRQEVVKVNGLISAQNYQMTPNSSALLIDTNNPIVYLCMTDGSGMKTVTQYTITEYKPEDNSEYKALSDRISKLEEIINESHTKSDERKHEFDSVVESFEKWQP